MANDEFKITIHMVSSLDGYIAKKDNSISWFETPDVYENGTTVSETDQAAFLTKIDCYVMGSHTYEHAHELSEKYGWPYGEIPTIVLSHRALQINRQNVEIYSGDLKQLVNEKLRPIYKNVWMVGGAKLTKNILRLNLADEIRQIIIPIILGGGTPFYNEIGQEHPLHLSDVKAYKNGMVELSYEIIKPK